MQLKPHWIDIPLDKVDAVLGYTNSDTDNLQKLFSAYHQLNKDQLCQLLPRINTLEAIGNYLLSWNNSRVKSYEKKKHLQALAQIAKSKALYLKKLLEIADIELSGQLDSYLNNWHYNTEKSQLDPKIYQPLYLNDQRFFSLNKKAYWGDFWWTTLDPCHRQLTHYLLIYESTVKRNIKYSVDFFLWLETQFVPKDIPKELYMDTSLREQCQLQVHKDKITYGDQSSVDHLSDKPIALFVLGPDHKLYLKEEEKDLYHSSFFSAHPVYCAGKILLQKGQIKEVSYESGHYIPSIKAGYQLFLFLRTNGFEQKNEVKISFFYDRNKLTALCEPDQLQSFQKFKKNLNNSIYQYHQKIEKDVIVI